MNRFEEMLEIAKACEKDFRKFYEKGNKSAGVRLRKHMQKMRSFAKSVRDEVQELNSIRYKEKSNKDKSKIKKSA